MRDKNNVALFACFAQIGSRKRDRSAKRDVVFVDRFQLAVVQLRTRRKNVDVQTFRRTNASEMGSDIAAAKNGDFSQLSYSYSFTKTSSKKFF